MKNRYFLAIFLAVVLLVSACAAPPAAPATPAAPAAPAAPAEAAAPAAPAPAMDGAPGYNGETYIDINQNDIKSTEKNSLVTFSLKVDTASYTNVMRYIESGVLPPADAVRTEELINYFKYDGDIRIENGPFGITTEIGPSPFEEGKYIMFTRVVTKQLEKSQMLPNNLTFLIDTSGSMNSFDKLPLLQSSFTLLVETLDENDIVSIVTYAGSSAIVLDSVSGADKNRIIEAINNLQAGGSTAGADGINTAYALAQKNFKQYGNNRIILATDGDFNVGTSNTNELGRLVAKKRESGIYLSILGFGTGNIRDDIMETLSKEGNGNYAYIDSKATAKKVLVDELGQNLYTIANDVKAQVEFNPENVISYRLIGYENRKLNNRDFEDDRKDAGEIGVGTDVVIMFELELAGAPANTSLKYGDKKAKSKPLDYSDELMEVRIRYKDPGENQSKLILKPYTFGSISDNNSSDFNFACSVAAFGELLRNSAYAKASVDDIITLAQSSRGSDASGYRLDFLRLLREFQRFAR